MQPASCQDADNTAAGAKSPTASAGTELAQGPPGKRLPPLGAAVLVCCRTRHKRQKKKRGEKKKREGRRWSVLHSLFRNKVHLGNRCCCCNKPGTTGCSLAPSPKCAQGESGPGAAAGAAPVAGTSCLSNQNLSVLHSQTGRAATVLDQLFLCILHPSHP